MAQNTKTSHSGSMINMKKVRKFNGHLTLVLLQTKSKLKDNTFWLEKSESPFSFKI